MTRGGSRGRKKPSLNDLSRHELSLEELQLWKQELSSGTDRACALVGAAYLDHILKAAISSHFRREIDASAVEAIFVNAQAPLSSLSGKIDIAYALEHIGAAARKDLHAIRRIRNAFAHSPRPVAFENPLVAKECDTLSEPSPGYAVANVSTHRAKFILRCLDLTLTIQEKSQSIWKARLKQLKATIESLDGFSQGLKDPANPLNPNYRGPEGS